MSNTQTPSPFGHECTCREMLQLVLDGVATQEQEIWFREHICSCVPCSSQYEVHTEIKQLLRTKCCDAAPPADLLISIRQKLNDNG